MGDAETQKMFEEAVSLHRAGRAAEAEALYARVLAREPGHVDALHLMGLLARQTGRGEMAVELISRASAGSPNVAEIQSNLGLALADVGRRAEAVAALLRA